MNEISMMPADESEARSGMYRFFSNVFLGPPDEALVQKLPELLHLDDLRSLFESETIKVLQGFAAELEQEELPALRQEYFDLFVVPTKRYVAPFEDVYRECMPGSKLDKGPLLGTHAISVIRTYRRAGAAMIDDCKELPTHAGVEFSFMSFLCDRETEAWHTHRKAADADIESQTSNQINQYRELQRAFLQQHLAVWLPQLRRAVQANALTPYFSGMTELSEQYITRDLAGISVPINTFESEAPGTIHG